MYNTVFLLQQVFIPVILSPFYLHSLFLVFPLFTDFLKHPHLLQQSSLFMLPCSWEPNVSGTLVLSAKLDSELLKNEWILGHFSFPHSAWHSCGWKRTFYKYYW